MLVWKKILWLRERIAEQEGWINRCGGNLAGYIARYGDPGVPPVDANGVPFTLCLTAEQQKLFPVGYLTPVPGKPNTFYHYHTGDGGTAIYNADCNRLLTWQQELYTLESHCYGAVQKANEMQGKVHVTPEDE